jgi:hypothetical protein
LPVRVGGLHERDPPRVFAAGLPVTENDHRHTGTQRRIHKQQTAQRRLPHSGGAPAQSNRLGDCANRTLRNRYVERGYR